MRSNVYEVARLIERGVWKSQGDTDLHDGYFRDGDGDVHSTKYMDSGLKLISTYYSHRQQIIDNVIKPLKKITSLLHEYTGVIGYISAQAYKLTIKANARQLHVDRHILVAGDGKPAVRDLHSAMMKLRKIMSRHHSAWQVKADYPHITYKAGLHTHGMVFSAHRHYSREARLMTAYLNKYLPFDVTVAMKPLEDRTYSHIATIEDLSAVYQWLTYAHRSGKLAFPSTCNPYHYLNEWNKLSQQGKADYVRTCYNSLSGKHAHYNYTYSFKRELSQMEKCIQTVIALAHIHHIMHESHVVAQQSLISTAEVDNNPENAYYSKSAFSGKEQAHHYTTAQNVARAYRQQHIQKETKAIEARIHTFEAISAEKQRISTQKGSISNEANRARVQIKPTTTEAEPVLLSRASGVPP